MSTPRFSYCENHGCHTPGVGYGRDHGNHRPGDTTRRHHLTNRLRSRSTSSYHNAGRIHSAFMRSPLSHGCQRPHRHCPRSRTGPKGVRIDGCPGASFESPGPHAYDHSHPASPGQDTTRPHHIGRRRCPLYRAWDGLSPPCFRRSSDPELRRSERNLPRELVGLK
jgi:hypothetical protein